MSIAIYSPEDYPKFIDGGMTDYRQAFGVQVILHAHQWTELDELGYKQVYYNSWQDSEGKEIFISSKQLAERIVGDYKMRGLRWANLDKISPEEKKAIEMEGDAQNLKFRKMMVERFEIAFRVASQGQPGGRLVPNAYEDECYKLLGMMPPEIVQRVQVQSNLEPVMVQPDPALMAQLVSQEVARQMERLTAPKG